MDTQCLSYNKKEDLFWILFFIVYELELSVKAFDVKVDL